MFSAIQNAYVWSTELHTLLLMINILRWAPLIFLATSTRPANLKAFTIWHQHSLSLVKLFIQVENTEKHLSLIVEHSVSIFSTTSYGISSSSAICFQHVAMWPEYLSNSFSSGLHLWWSDECKKHKITCYLNQTITEWYGYIINSSTTKSLCSFGAYNYVLLCSHSIGILYWEPHKLPIKVCNSKNIYHHICQNRSYTHIISLFITLSTKQ